MGVYIGVGGRYFMLIENLVLGDLMRVKGDCKLDFLSVICWKKNSNFFDSNF